MFNILVVDDKKEKREDIMSLLVECGFDQETIYQADCIRAAKEKLKSDRMDLLVVDICLPNHVEGTPLNDGGINLLDEIFKKSTYNNPRYVVGVTSYSEVKGSLDGYFEERLWYLLYQQDGDTEWSERLTLFFKNIADSNLPSEYGQYHNDVFIMAAKRDVELKALQDIDLDWGKLIPLDDSSFYRKGSITAGGNEFSVCIGSPPKMGLVSTTMYTQKVIEKLKPRLVVMTGICAGIESECNLGDILVASRSWEWQSGKHNGSSGVFDIEPDQISVPEYVVSRFQELADDSSLLARLHAEWRANKPASLPVIHTGPVVSGSSVLSSTDRVDEIKEQHRKLLGIEMEIYGMYYSAFYGSTPKPTFFALKVVSDFANENKGNDFQAYGSYLSANIAIEFIRRHADFLMQKAGRY